MTAQNDDLMAWIGVAADLFGSDTELDESGIADTLTGQGCHPDLANIIVDYLPSAFAEPALERLGVSRLSTYRRKLTDGRTVEYNWQDDRIWLAAREFVQTQISNGDWAKYQHIGLRSAELRAVSDALNAGSEMAGGTCAVAPLSILPPDSPFLPRRRQWRWFRA